MAINEIIGKQTKACNYRSKKTVCKIILIVILCKCETGISIRITLTSKAKEYL